MTPKEPIIFCFSSGKDSSIAIHTIRQQGKYDIATLLTTITKDYDRTSMHGIRTSILARQAESLGLPLEKVFITKKSTNADYERQMQIVLQKYFDCGIRKVAFGDIFLEDLKQYRQNQLARVQMEAIFPIWKIDTTKLANDFIDAGFKARVTCVDTDVLDQTFAGRSFDRQFLADLPESIDPCGENGEFHSFVYDGPIFKTPIGHEPGETVLRDNRFCFCDMIPA
ncbi:MAG: adenine nucleotide alpha hydrolase [Phycisphaerae bacterium]|nr:adenine nucleotide alpha hydrolase [Phycisphaerae bacterium]